MGKDTGFIEFEKQAVPRREIHERVKDFREYDLNYSDNDIRQQASRCMDCGIPFCHMGCPLGNMIPDWNDLVYRDQWQDALGALHSTNNFPEFTGRICPAPCEDSCVLNEHYTLDPEEKIKKNMPSPSSRSKSILPNADGRKAGFNPNLRGRKPEKKLP